MPKPASPFDGVAWVTGASTGIGRATALKLAHKGWRVAVTARSREKLEKLRDDAEHAYGKIIVMDGDVADDARMKAIVEELERDHGGIGLAILNAGIYEPIHGNQLVLEVFQRTISVNINGTLNCLLPLISTMKGRQRGQIALVSSVAGYGGLPTSSAYGASKAALINLAESLKFDLDKMGILIQVINPGFVDTPATKSNPFTMPMLMDVDDAAEALMGGLSKGRFEITFPKGFTYMMKLINLLPYWAYFPFVNKFTKWKNRPLEGEDTPPSKEPIKRW